MKTSKLIGFAISLVSLLAISKGAIAASTDDNRPGYTYVMVAGSLLPQKVKIHAIGTKTAYPLRIYDRHEIDQTGRVTTEDVLAQDPSLSVVRGRPSGSR